MALACFDFPPDPARTADARKWGRITVGLLGTLYLLLLNTYWVPGGDSDFYVAVARTLARGGSFEYNGLPVSISPPGWPWVMALVMKVSPTFLALKVVTLVCMLSSLGLAYRCCLRFATPRTSALAVMLAGTLLPVYSLTYFLHSEGLFCLLGMLALLHALRLSEGHARGWEIASLLLLCVILPVVRWAGIFQTLLVCGALAKRTAATTWRVYLGRLALGSLCLLLTLATTMLTRYALQLTPTQIQLVKDAGGGFATDSENADAAEPATNPASPTDPVVAPGGRDWEPPPIVTSTQSGFVKITEEYGQRFLRAGKWLGWLLWYPTRFASVNKPLDFLVSVFGWIAIILVLATTVRDATRGQYVWLAIVLYAGALVMGWPNPNARYFVPIAPFLMLAVIIGVPAAGQALGGAAVRMKEARGERRMPRRRTRFVAVAGRLDGLEPLLARGPKFVRPFTLLFVGSIVICNLATLGVDIRVMRSGDNFYDRFEAGQHAGVVSICHALLSDKQPLDAGDIVVAERYENLNRIRHIGTGPREVVLLSDEVIRTLPRKFSKADMPAPGTRAWMRETRSNFFVFQEASVPWRVWHFHVPMWLHEKLAKRPTTALSKPSGGWHVYELKLGDLAEMPVPKVRGWPTRVPGM